MSGQEKKHPAEHVSSDEWSTSPWPFFMSLGILFMLPLAFSFYFVYDVPMRAVISLGIGVPLVVLSIGGWLKESLLETGQKLTVTGMPFFIIAEAFIFVAFFAAYWATRLLTPSWPPSGTPDVMPVVVPVIMTITLASSSVTIQTAERRLDAGDNKGFLKWLTVTILLGTAFFCLSAYEWNHLFAAGFGFKTNIYSTSFYSITGFHASHVLVGLGIFIAVLIPALSGRVSTGLVRAGAIYWHFVDIVWIFVVTQVYFW